ncbi:putative nucleotidyltransferase substrate binding domain-containing protein, partial [Escherichia coli]
ALCDELQHHLFSLVQAHPSFIRTLTRDAISTQPPLGIFKNLVLEKNGDNSKVLNIKRYALTLIIDLARIYGLSAGSTHNDTEARFLHAHEQQQLSEESYKNIIGAYRFIMKVRFVHQLIALKKGLKPDNHIDPDRFG